MLTIELLKQNAKLSGLSDEQLSVISEMSKNDENTVIGNKIGALHGQYDADIFSVTGNAKREGEKSYDYAKRVLGEYKAQLGSIPTLQAKISNLEKQLSDSADGGQPLKDALAQVAALQAQLGSVNSELTTIKDKAKQDLQNLQVDYAFSTAFSGLSFKPSITEPLQKALIQAAKAEVLAKGKPDFVQNASGETSLVFRDAKGDILNNPKNNLNPYTVRELVMETSLKDALAVERRQTGAGTQASQQENNSGEFVDIASAKNQVEADKLIEAYLLQNGVTRDSVEFSEKSLQLRQENKVSDLPLR